MHADFHWTSGSSDEHQAAWATAHDFTMHKKSWGANFRRTQGSCPLTMPNYSVPVLLNAEFLETDFFILKDSRPLDSFILNDLKGTIAFGLDKATNTLSFAEVVIRQQLCLWALFLDRGVVFMVGLISSWKPNYESNPMPEAPQTGLSVLVAWKLLVLLTKIKKL